MRFPPGCRFLKLDVKEFYLSGSHEYLVSQSASILDSSIRDDYKLLASVVLGNQYVRSPALPSKHFNVISGTGMGMIPSGSISDAVLYSALEAGFVF